MAAHKDTGINMWRSTRPVKRIFSIVGHTKGQVFILAQPAYSIRIQEFQKYKYLYALKGILRRLVLPYHWAGSP